MPIVLTNNSYRIAVRDEISGERVVFDVLRPTIRQRSQYRKADDITLANVEFGLKILKGIRDGDFLIPPDEHENADNLKEKYITVDDEYYLPMSSDPNSEYFILDWKKLIGKYADALIGGIADKFFNKPVSVEDFEPDMDF